MKSALRVFDHGQLGPRRIEGPGDDLAAERFRLRRGGVGVVDGERDTPVRRSRGVVIGDRIEGGDDVDESFGGAHLRHLLAKARGASPRGDRRSRAVTT